MNKTSYYWRSIYYLFLRWVIRKNYLLVSVPDRGLRFKFKTEDALGRMLFKRRECEPGVTQCFMNNVRLEENDVVLDVGANIGWYAVLFNKYSPLPRAFTPLNRILSTTAFWR